jgi:hypothetical protein
MLSVFRGIDALAVAVDEKNESFRMFSVGELGGRQRAGLVPAAVVQQLAKKTTICYVEIP